ncbi:MAG: 3-dehydroquinate synthase [Thermoplasmata archaeon]
MELKADSGTTKILFTDAENFLMNLKGRSRVLIVIDENIQKLYGGRFKGLDKIILPPGESSKTLGTVKKIYEKFLKLDVDRSSLIIGVGGGTISDITGFAAATFMRGVPFGFVPTTLLAQVDASIGGKNGVNFKGLKNMIGTVRQPEFCVVDFSFLKSLPFDQLISGVAEIVKYGVILDRRLFGYLENNHSRIVYLEKASIDFAVSNAISAKISIVQRDEKDAGERMKLNFGHTVGHAIEKVTGLPHGHSIAIGMIAESRLSALKGFLPDRDVGRIEELLKAIGLPTRSRANRRDVMEAITKDKKGSGDAIKIALPERIGRSSIYKIRKGELKEAVEEVCI